MTLLQEELTNTATIIYVMKKDLKSEIWPSTAIGGKKKLKSKEIEERTRCRV